MLIDGAARHRDLAAAEAWMQEAISRGRADLQCYAAMIKACARVRPEACEAWLARLEQDGGGGAWRMMRRRGLKPTRRVKLVEGHASQAPEVVYGTVISLASAERAEELLARRGQSAEVLSLGLLHGRMMASGLAPNVRDLRMPWRSMSGGDLYVRGGLVGEARVW